MLYQQSALLTSAPASAFFRAHRGIFTLAPWIQLSDAHHRYIDVCLVELSNCTAHIFQKTSPRILHSALISPTCSSTTTSPYRSGAYYESMERRRACKTASWNTEHAFSISIANPPYSSVSAISRSGPISHLGGDAEASGG